jgi:hypothetical protein
LIKDGMEGIRHGSGLGMHGAAPLLVYLLVTVLADLGGNLMDGLVGNGATGAETEQEGQGSGLQSQIGIGHGRFFPRTSGMKGRAWPSWSLYLSPMTVASTKEICKLLILIYHEQLKY